MTALFQKIAAQAVAVGVGDDRVGAFDSGGESEIPGALLGVAAGRLHTLRRRAAAFNAGRAIQAMLS